MKEIRIGILGGRRGSAYYEPIAKTNGFSVVAIADADPRIREEIREWAGEAVAVCESLDEMLDVGLDAVILSNFFHQHAPFAIRAMEAGVDVISETTAAMTPGECLDLLECVERTGRRYMLAANCPEMIGPGELTRVYQSGEMGEVLYAEAEYFHPLLTDKEVLSIVPTPEHWRSYLPGIYYNMHSLGVLMASTGLEPREVCGMEIATKSCESRHAGLMKNKSAGGVALYKMDNGSVFRSTGWCKMGPAGKWFRLSCEKGTVETERTNQDRILLRKNSGETSLYDPMVELTEEEKATGHGGADGRTCRRICQYLAGEREPDFDIYKSVILSLAGIYAHLGNLDGKTYRIPDVRDKTDREILRGDDRSPIPNEAGKLTLAYQKDM